MQATMQRRAAAAGAGNRSWAPHKAGLLQQPIVCSMRRPAFSSSQSHGCAKQCSGLAQTQVLPTAASGVHRARGVSRSVRGLAARAEISYVMVKPDGVQRGLVGDIISRFERKGFKLLALKLYQTPQAVAEEHYKELASKPFYGKLVEYIVSGPVVAMVWEGSGVVASARKLIGATNPLAAEPGTIRGDFAIEVGRNIVHGSDSVENGERETALWFPEGVAAWEQTMTPWLKE